MLTVLTGDAIDQIRTLPDESAQCCVTSPPYWGLRDYGTAAWEGGDARCDHRLPATGGNPVQGANKGNNNFEAAPFKEICGKCGARRIDSQLGLEKTPEEYVANMVEVFREVRRVLRKDGTLWLNLGDSYASDFKGSGGPSDKQLSNAGSRFNGSRLEHGLKPKDLCGIPWRVAFALQRPHLKCKGCGNVAHEDQWGRWPNGRKICPSCEKSKGNEVAEQGWWLRSDIIWAKPNPMPESVTDRPTKSHEYLFLLTKASSYFYDAEAIKEKSIWAEDPRADQGHIDYNGKRNGADGQGQRAFCSIDSAGRNKRSIWTVATAPYPEAHFATYPPDLIKPCILAGSRVGDTVLDPFAGSGTSGMVALELGRKAVLIELNPKYCDLIRQRCDVTLGLQLA